MGIKQWPTEIDVSKIKEINVTQWQKTPESSTKEDRTVTEQSTTDPINPSHYRSHPSGIEAIEITEHMSYCLGNAIKYIWRAGLKSESQTEDLHKAIWYLQREIQREKNDGL